MTNEHIFYVLFAIQIFFGEMSVQIFCPFLKIGLLIIEFAEFLCIFYIQVFLSGM